MGHDPVEGRKQGIDLAFPPVQLLWDQQTVRRVVRAHRDWIDATMRLPFRQTPPKISFKARRGLVALLGILGEELHGKRRRQHARKHLVQGHAKRVKIAATINRAIHAAGLLGRHVGEGAGNDFRRRGRLRLARQLGCNPESGQPNGAVAVDEHVRRLYVFMDQATPMDLAKCCRQANSDAQDAGEIERLPRASLKNQI